MTMSTPHHAPQGHTPTPETDAFRAAFNDVDFDGFEYADEAAQKVYSLAEPLLCSLEIRLRSTTNALSVRTDEAEGLAGQLSDSHARLLTATARQSQRIAELEGALGDCRGWLQGMRDALMDMPAEMDTDPEEVRDIEALQSRVRTLLAASTLNQTEQGK